jgi:deazaflavin-dependent oxidoreductase (nitroreductase family)
MNEKIKRALENDRLIDITTIGRKSGQPRRIEIRFHSIGGKIYLSGLPGKRGWYANLLAGPHFTFHLKQSVQVDIAATGRAITDDDERRALFPHVIASFGRPAEALEKFMEGSKLVEVTLHTEEFA